jgi:hypothetical protein
LAIPFSHAATHSQPFILFPFHLRVCIYRTRPIRTYRNRQRPLMTRAEMVLETFIYWTFIHLMRLLAPDYFIEFGRRGIFKLCNVRLVKGITIRNMRFLNLRAASIRRRCDAMQSRTYALTYQSFLLLPFCEMKRQTGPPKCCYLPTRTHCISSLKTSTLKTIFVITFTKRNRN